VDRITVIGCGGSGKTYLANQLGAALGLPVTHLDAIYYDANWNRLPAEEFAELQRELAAAPRWLIEGNYASSLPIRLAATDTVIFLDLPAATCLLGILQRRWWYRGGQHTQVGVYDRITWNFVKYIVSYRTAMLPRVEAAIAVYGAHARLVRLTSRRQAAAFLTQVTARNCSASCDQG
jgi:adenylate kinase family enzyme